MPFAGAVHSTDTSIHIYLPCLVGPLGSDRGAEGTRPVSLPADKRARLHQGTVYRCGR